MPRPNLQLRRLTDREAEQVAQFADYARRYAGAFWRNLTHRHRVLYDDLLSAAHIGAIRGVLSYDPNKGGYSLEHHVGWKMQREIYDYLKANHPQFGFGGLRRRVSWWFTKREPNAGDINPIDHRRHEREYEPEEWRSEFERLIGPVSVPEHREMFVAYFVEGLTRREISVRFRKSESWVSQVFKKNYTLIRKTELTRLGKTLA